MGVVADSLVGTLGRGSVSLAGKRPPKPGKVGLGDVHGAGVAPDLRLRRSPAEPLGFPWDFQMGF